MKLTLHHHVYSSVGGYKTLYASPALPAPLVSDLEIFSKRSYTRLKGAPILCFLRLNDGTLCQTRIFSAGADHVGRSRTCVHNVLIRGDELRRIAYFNPLLLPDHYFLRGDSALKNFTTILPHHLDVDPAHFARLDVLMATPRQPQAVQLMLRAMLSTGRSLILRDPHNIAFGLMRDLFPLLPPGARRAYSIVRGAHLPQVLAGCGGVNATFIPAYLKLETLAQQPGNIVIDWSDADAQPRVVNLPAPNAYGRLLEDLLLLAPQPEKIRRLLALLEASDSGGVPSENAYSDLVQGYGHIVEAVTDDGGLSQEQLEAILPEGLNAVLPFWRAGLLDLALDLLSRHCAIGRAMHDDKDIRRWTDMIEKLTSRHDQLQGGRTLRIVELLVQDLSGWFEQVLHPEPEFDESTVMMPTDNVEDLSDTMDVPIPAGAGKSSPAPSKTEVDSALEFDSGQFQGGESAEAASVEASEKDSDSDSALDFDVAALARTSPEPAAAVPEHDQEHDRPEAATSRGSRHDREARKDQKSPKDPPAESSRRKRRYGETDVTRILDMDKELAAAGYVSAQAQEDDSGATFEDLGNADDVTGDATREDPLDGKGRKDHSKGRKAREIKESEDKTPVPDDSQDSTSFRIFDDDSWI